MRMLVIEEIDVDQLQEIQTLLQEVGYRVEAVKDEISALGVASRPGLGARRAAIRGSQKDLARVCRPKSLSPLPENWSLIKEGITRVAHAILYPVQRIMISTRFLEKITDLNGDHSKQLKRIRESVTELDTLVDHLLTYSHSMDLYCRPINVNHVLDGVLFLSEIERLIEAHAIRVVRSYEKDLPAISLDPFKMRRAFANLITNALQSMSAGGALTLCTRSLPARDFLEVTLQDTGDGISPSHLERVFDPFFSTQPERIGLGLSIVQQIVDFHGGQVQVESQPGQGSTFHILLPIRADPCAG